MSSWVGSWLRGNEGEENENTSPPSFATESSISVPTAEEIRRKRLERLQALEAGSRQDQAASTPEKPQFSSEPTELKDIGLGLQKSPSVLASGDDVQVRRKAKIENVESQEGRAVTRESAHKIFMNNMLQRILKVTFKIGEKDKYLHLPSCSTAISLTVQNTDGSSQLLSIENYSEALYARLTVRPDEIMRDQAGNQDPVAAVLYLEKCFYRCFDELDVLQSNRPIRSLTAEQRQEAIVCVQSLSQLCVNYIVTSITEPEIFPFEVGNIMLEAWEKVIRTQSNANTPMLIEKVAVGLKEQDGEQFALIFSAIFQKLIAELFLIQPPSLLSNFYENMNLLIILCRMKSVASIFTSISGFLLSPHAPITGRRLQDATALGIVLRFSTFQDSNVQQMFNNITKRTKQEVDHNIHTLQMKMTSVQTAGTEIFRSLLKAGGPTRQQVLTWIQQAIQVNAGRAKENFDVNTTSSNGMMLNLTMVLLRLCGPFLPPETKKASLISPEFVACGSPVFPSDITKLVTITSSEDTAQYETQETNDFNFITQCYFFTARAVHLGPVATITQYTRLARQLSFIQRRMSTDSDPRIRAHFEGLVCNKIVMDAELLHPDLLHELIRFILLSSTVVTSICRLASTQRSAELVLPLPELAISESSKVIQKFPEHIVDDICTILIFIARVSPKALSAFAFDAFLDMILIFLSSPSYVHSPHLRAKMSEVLYHAFLPAEETEENHTSAPILAVDLLSTHPLAREHLAPCLLALYGDVEQTGFYEKLEHRYHIACLLKFLWKVPEHKPAFVRISADSDKFVKFAHGLMNHINSLITDALIALPEIKQLQEEMQDVAGWTALDDAMREQKQSLLADKERTVTSSLQLANETIHMMSYLTSEIQMPFLQMPELEERLVSMLNSVLVKLAGPRGIELKVNNPEQYRFRPKIMLKEIVETLLHFSGYTSFQQAVAVNGYYDDKVFTKCVHILRRTQLLPVDQINRFESFTRDVALLAAQAADDEAMLGEIPDEFLDPLVLSLMKDPVKLPTSGYTMDRATIAQHLLNDQSDPFTRAPLTLDDLVPDLELKKKMDEWIASARQK